MPKNTFHNLDDEKRERVVSTAIKEFADKGYLKSSMQSIANNAEIAKGSMYQYFENKKELFLYITDLAIQAKIDYMSTLMEENQSFNYFEIIQNMLLTSFKYYKEYPDLYQIYQAMLNGLQKEANIEVNEKISKLVHVYNKDLLMNALKNKEIRNDLELDLVSFMVYGLIKNFGTYLIDRDSLTSDEEWHEYVSQFIELLKNGLKANSI